MSSSSIREKAQIIVVEGNISAGKSTLIKKLATKLNCIYYEEPISSNPYLTLFYENPHQYAFIMQMWLLKQRYLVYIKAMIQAQNGKTVILDRSVFSDWVFAKNCHNDHLMTTEEFQQYCEQYFQLMKYLPDPDVVIYLETLPQTCYDRIHHMRKRDCESSIELTYLEGLHSFYSVFIQRMNKDNIILKLYDWNNFGSTKKIIEDITSSYHLLQSDKVFDIYEFRTFLFFTLFDLYVDKNYDEIIHLFKTFSFFDLEQKDIDLLIKD